MTQSRLIAIFIALATVVMLGAIGLYAYNAQNLPRSVEQIEKQIAEDTTQTEELNMYNMVQFGYFVQYPDGWNVHLDDTDPNRLIIDPPGENPNPYSQDQGEYTNPTDDITIYPVKTSAVLEYIVGSGINHNAYKRINTKDHTTFVYSPPSESITTAYLINIIDDLYIEVISSGDLSNLEYIVDNLKFSTYPKPNPFLESTNSSTEQISTNLVSFVVPNQQYIINHPTGWNIRLSEDPDDSSVTIDPPGEGPNPYGQETGEWTNPTDDILLQKVTIPDWNQFMLDNMIPAQTTKSLMIEGKQAWLVTKGQSESVTYAYLIKLSDTQYLEVSSMGSVETLATIALKLGFE